MLKKYNVSSSVKRPPDLTLRLHFRSSDIDRVCVCFQSRYDFHEGVVIVFSLWASCC